VRPVVVIPIPCTQGMALIVLFIKNLCIVIYWNLIWYKTNEHSLQVSHVVNVVNQLSSDLAVHQWFPTFSCRDPEPAITAWLPTMIHYILCAFQHSIRIPLLTLTILLIFFSFSYFHIIAFSALYMLYGRMIVNKEMGKMCEELAEVYFNILLT
jgi:hypothetical protein